MDFSEIQKLINQFENSEICELKIDQDDFHLYLNKNRVSKTEATVVQTNLGQEPISSTEKSEENISPAVTETDDHETKDDSNATAVKSPLVGVVYLQSKPGVPPFVKVGDRVKKGDTICIIEAMKMMTEVKSDVSGTVGSVEVENEDLVEVDQPLILVKED